MTELAAPLAAALADRYRLERELGPGGMAALSAGLKADAVPTNGDVVTTTADAVPGTAPRPRGRRAVDRCKLRRTPKSLTPDPPL
jgi:hypothetical protein